VNTPPAQAGGFGLQLKAGLIGQRPIETVGWAEHREAQQHRPLSLRA
jgi:hypothetical protein